MAISTLHFSLNFFVVLFLYTCLIVGGNTQYMKLEIICYSLCD